MQTLALTPAHFEGAVSVEETADGLRPWRLPLAQKELFYPEDGLMMHCGRPTGVRVRFETDADRLALRVAPAETDRKFDLVANNELLATCPVPAGEQAAHFGGLTGERRVYEIWLPQTDACVCRALELPDGASVAAAPPDARLRWITYGSSITNCADAHSPARTWPGIAARMLDLHLTCMGFGGNCHADAVVAMTMRDLPADLITLSIGINVYGASSLAPRSFQPAVIGFIRILRERHTDVPIAFTTPIVSPPREATPNAVGMTLADYRSHGEAAIRKLRDCGDEHLMLFDGLEVFGEEFARYLPDDLHPNGDGYQVLGRRMADIVVSKALAAARTG